VFVVAAVLKCVLGLLELEMEMELEVGWGLWGVGSDGDGELDKWAANEALRPRRRHAKYVKYIQKPREKESLAREWWFLIP